MKRKKLILDLDFSVSSTSYRTHSILQFIILPEGEQIYSCFSQEHYRKVKHKQLCPEIELGIGDSISYDDNRLCTSFISI